MDQNMPDPAALARRPSTFSTSTYSTTSSSSPEFTADSVITPDSEEDVAPSVVPKTEQLDDSPLEEFEDAKDAVTAGPIAPPAPRKRGRPRKHPIVEQKKASHARSKTGCGTCRRRKKKCDETKPGCINCEKNNVVCDGYEPRQPWRSGKQRSLTIRSSVPAELPMLVEGIDGTVDQMFFHHFTAQVGKVLSLTDHQNPFLEIIVPMAMGHAGLMHSLLYLSGSCLVAREPTPRAEWEERQEHHSSKAMRLLQQDLSESSEVGEDAVATIGDPSIAQTLVLCLQTVCAGDLTGSYRFHLNAMKEMLTQRQRSFPNEQLRQFILEFLLYHDYSSSITSLHNPLDQRSFDLMAGFKLPEFMIQPQAGTLLGVMDGLFGFISRIRQLRDHIRQRRAEGQGHWWDAPIIDDAFAIDNALRSWKCVHPPDSPRYPASLLYRQCTWIYLHRTIQLSKPSETFQQAVDEGLQYLRMLPWETDDGSTQSILLMPLFLLGCAAFDPDQRPEISAAFQRLQDWSNLGNIKYARIIVEQIWEMMDHGQEEETWDWETIIAARGWDFLVT
ncbi:hypothetical protein LTR36_003675 [Oleoguttula mirabilis]|uniref:Zn(2)-C6 fungal-type domain-containing protein n=1 Tax=Oleoguttula mirabilis TaxID=1507867 RepID=A0AAV9JJJ1_9PEZI|nr:hypothetical protein LTR36_003675 [Oleoguttula mirabilis]